MVPDSVPAEIAQHINTIASFVVRDFVCALWYNQINVSKSPEFPNTVHALLLHILYTFGLLLTKLNPAFLAAEMLKIINQHIREYRKYEMANLSLSDYIAKHPESQFAAFHCRESVIKKLRDLAARLCVFLMPSNEIDCLGAFAIIKEVFACHVLLPLVEHQLANAAWINRTLLGIISYHVKSNSDPVLRKSTSSNTVRKISLASIFQAEDGLVSFVQFLETEDARYIPLYIMINALNRTKSNERTTIIQRAENILHEFFDCPESQVLDFGDLKSTLSFIVKLRIRIKEPTCNSAVLNPLAKMVTKYLEPKYLDAYHSSELYAEFLKDNLNALDNSNSTTTIRYKSIQKRIQDCTDSVVVLDDEVQTAEVEDLPYLLRRKFKLQIQINELQELLESEEIDSYTNRMGVLSAEKMHCEVTVDNDILNAVTRNSPKYSFKFIVEESELNWTRVVELTDLSELFKSLLDYYPRIESEFPVPDIETRKADQDLVQVWLQRLMNDFVFMFTPVLLDFICQETQEEFRLKKRITVAFKNAIKSVKDVKQKGGIIK